MSDMPLHLANQAGFDEDEELDAEECERYRKRGFTKTSRLTDLDKKALKEGARDR